MEPTRRPVSAVLRDLAGRWTPRSRPGFRLEDEPEPMPLPVRVPLTARPVAGPEWTEGEGGMWLAAGLVQAGDLVHIAGRWHEVARVDARRGSDEFGRTTGPVVLYMEGWQASCRFGSLVCVWDDAAQAIADVKRVISQ